jgi:CheY-like chemotaxis protein
MRSSIVVADDDPDILSIVSASLKTQGYEVHQATNGREAVDQVRAHHPDLVIMDMMMPVMSGYEATSELKADESTKSIPIVALSAKAMAADVARAADAGVDGYITKPFRMAQVLSTIEEYI